MSDFKQRYLFIDLLRFVAAFFMIQGHVFDAVLSPELKAHSSYYMHDFFHGFVAPAFLFASGVAYGISTMRKWDEHIVWGLKVQRRLGRFLGLIAIGYALHLPYFSLRKTLREASAEEMKALLQSDVLQCIGVTLLLLQIGVLLTKNKKVFGWIVAAAAALVIFSSPILWSARLSGRLPAALVSYLTPENASWFPLFPWSAYILWGVLFGCIFAKVRDPIQAIFRSAAINIGILVVAWGVMYLPFDLYPAHDFWKSNPSMFFVRSSVVSIVASFIFLVEHWSGIAPHFPSLMGRESLFIYIVHLVIVYGSVLNRGLAQRIGPTLPLFQTLGIFALVFGAIAAITGLWNYLKTTRETAASWVAAGGAAAFLFEFVRRPW